MRVTVPDEVKGVAKTKGAAAAVRVCALSFFLNFFASFFFLPRVFSLCFSKVAYVMNDAELKGSIPADNLPGRVRRALSQEVHPLLGKKLKYVDTELLAQLHAANRALPRGFCAAVSPTWAQRSLTRSQACAQVFAVEDAIPMCVFGFLCIIIYFFSFSFLLCACSSLSFFMPLRSPLCSFS